MRITTIVRAYTAYTRRLNRRLARDGRYVKVLPFLLNRIDRLQKLYASNANIFPGIPSTCSTTSFLEPLHSLERNLGRLYMYIYVSVCVKKDYSARS